MGHWRVCDPTLKWHYSGPFASVLTCAARPVVWSKSQRCDEVCLKRAPLTRGYAPSAEWRCNKNLLKASLKARYRTAESSEHQFRSVSSSTALSPANSPCSFVIVFPDQDMSPAASAQARQTTRSDMVGQWALAWNLHLKRKFCDVLLQCSDSKVQSRNLRE